MENLYQSLEFFETPQWAVLAILKNTEISNNIYDPCAGLGAITETLRTPSKKIFTTDIKDWGYSNLDRIHDFLDEEINLPFKAHQFDIIMNPPFSKACEFVVKAHVYKPQKILCFQRFAWLESRERKTFWDFWPPNTIYLCGNRATCWRADVPAEKRLSGTTTAHAWFEWNLLAPAKSTIVKRLYKSD